LIFLLNFYLDLRSFLIIIYIQRFMEEIKIKKHTKHTVMIIFFLTLLFVQPLSMQAVEVSEVDQMIEKHISDVAIPGIAVGVIKNNDEFYFKTKGKTGQGEQLKPDRPMFITGIISEKDSGTNSNGLKYFSVDFGICFEHIMLAATAEGLGSCWIGWFDEDKVKSILEIPKKYRVIGLTPIGYPPEKEKGPVKDRKPLDEIVHQEQF